MELMHSMPLKHSQTILTFGQNALLFKCYFFQKANGTEQIHLTREFPSGTHFTAESTEAMHLKCIAQGHNIMMQTEF